MKFKIFMIVFAADSFLKTYVIKGADISQVGELLIASQAASELVLVIIAIWMLIHLVRNHVTVKSDLKSEDPGTHQDSRRDSETHGDVDDGSDD